MINPDFPRLTMINYDLMTIGYANGFPHDYRDSSPPNTFHTAHDWELKYRSTTFLQGFMAGAYLILGKNQ